MYTSIVKYVHLPRIARPTHQIMHGVSYYLVPYVAASLGLGALVETFGVCLCARDVCLCVRGASATATATATGRTNGTSVALPRRRPCLAAGTSKQNKDTHTRGRWY